MADGWRHAIGHLVELAGDVAADQPGLVEVLARVADPRRRRGARYRLGRRKLHGKKWSRETCYTITSLTATQASPAGLAAIIRGHWLTEDRLHWVRDLDRDEDRPQVRTASGPPVRPPYAISPSPSCA